MSLFSCSLSARPHTSLCRQRHTSHLHPRLCRGSSCDTSNDRARIEAEIRAQRQFHAASANTMTIRYCRDRSDSWFMRWLRGWSIDSNWDFRSWRRHQKATRHFSLWSPRVFFRGDNLRRLLFPDLAFVGTTSSCLCYYNVCLAGTSGELATSMNFGSYSHDAMLAMPVECFTLTSFALGLLVTFKTKTAYGRFLEGRMLWEKLTTESRALVSRIFTRVPSAAGEDCSEVRLAQQHAVKLVRTLSVVMKYHLTEEGCNPHIVIMGNTSEADVRSAATFALRAELVQIWNCDDAVERDFKDRIMSAGVGNRPLHVLHELGYINGSIFCHPAFGALDGPAGSKMDDSVAALQSVLGGCEKLLQTPIYTPYTKFTSRFLWLWCNTLPLALYPLVGPFATVPVSLVITFFMLGIEDIGSRVEQPFDVMPLWQYCDTVNSSCLQLVAHDELLRRRGPIYPEHDVQDDVQFSVRNDDNDRFGSYADPLGF